MNYNIGFFNNIKSKYILKRIFEYLQQKNLLEIIKYNKELQKELNIDINDYKTQIEIEIIPLENKFNTFINFYYDINFYHIYFNDNKEEIKRNYYNKGDKVEKIKIILDYEIKSFYELLILIKRNKIFSFYQNYIILF